VGIETIVAKKLRATLKSLYGEMEIAREWLGKPPSWNLGVVAILCFGLAKTLRRSPKDIAVEVAEHMTDSDMQAYPAGGYVNISISAEMLFERICKLAQRPSYGSRKMRRVIRVMIEYLSPNTNKPLHLGHVRNGVLGVAIARILEFTGHTVIKANLVNDRGIHICKSMLAWQRWGEGATPETTGIKPDHFVGHWYVRFEQGLKAQVAELRTHHPELADKSDKGLFAETELGRAAQEMLVAWENEDPDVRALWRMMNEWVYAGFAQTYELLGFSFDDFLYESDTYLLGKDLAGLGLDRGVFEVDTNGATIVHLPTKQLTLQVGESNRRIKGFGCEKGGRPKKATILRADGTSGYLTQDIGTAVLKFEKHNLERSIYVVASEQEHHFKVLFAVLAMLGFPWYKGCHHRSYGMVKLPSGKMKSREGTTVDADDLVRQVRDLAAHQVMARDNEIPEDQIEYRAARIADGALKFYLLAVAPANDMMYDPEKSLEFEGKTGPYVMYAYARCIAILQKSGSMDLQRPDFSTLGTVEETGVVMLLDRFPALVRRAAEKLDPSIIANYLFELAQAFSQFYHVCPVLTAEPGLMEARLELVAAISNNLQQGLYLLGIETIENM